MIAAARSFLSALQHDFSRTRRFVERLSREQVKCRVAHASERRDWRRAARTRKRIPTRTDRACLLRNWIRPRSKVEEKEWLQRKDVN